MFWNVRTTNGKVKGMAKEKSKSSEWDEAKIMRFELRVPASFVKLLDDWRRQQDDIPNRSEAIRRLVEAAAADAKSRKKGSREVK